MSQEKAVEAWWWTVRPTGSQCDNCLEPIPAHTAFAYRHATREGYCPICVDATGLAPHTSRRLARQSAPVAKPAPRAKPAKPASHLMGKSQSQKAARREAVAEALRSGPATTRDVAARTGLPVMLAGAALGRLQATGHVVRAARGSGRWQLVANPRSDTSNAARIRVGENSEKFSPSLAV